MNQRDELVGLYFKIKGLEAEVLGVDAQIQSLKNRKEEIEYNLHILTTKYNELGDSLKEVEDLPEEEPKTETEEEKPKKLKKTNV